MEVISESENLGDLSEEFLKNKAFYESLIDKGEINDSHRGMSIIICKQKILVLGTESETAEVCLNMPDEDMKDFFLNLRIGYRLEMTGIDRFNYKTTEKL